MHIRFFQWRNFAAAGLCAAVLAIYPALSLAQTAAPVPAAQAVALEPIDVYIHNAWDTLSRSMSDCKSVADPKLATTPILYLPVNVPEPPEIAALEKSCNVKVDRLPRRIQHIGDIKPGEIAHAGLLYLPNKYVVPGGRFNEMYGWDSYFIILGLMD